MKPKDVEVFENGDVSLEVHTLADDSQVYWVKAGVAAIQFDFDRFENLLELLNAYDVEHEILEDDDEPFWPLGAASMLAILIVFVVTVVVLGGMIQ